MTIANKIRVTAADVAAAIPLRPRDPLAYFGKIIPQKIAAFEQARQALATFIQSGREDVDDILADAGVDRSSLEFAVSGSPVESLRSMLESVVSLNADARSVGYAVQSAEHALESHYLKAADRAAATINAGAVDKAIADYATFAQQYNEPPPPAELGPALAAFAAQTVAVRQMLQSFVAKAGAPGLRESEPPPHEDVETLYHASSNARQLVQTGFSTEVPDRGGLGGSQSTKDFDIKGVSFTADLHIALQIARSLKEVAGIANRTYDFRDVEKWAADDGIDPEELRFNLKSREIPRENRDLFSPGTAQGDLDDPENVFRMYQAYLALSKERVNPMYFGVNINTFDGIDERDIGVIEAKVDMTDPRIAWFAGMAEFRVPPDAVLEVTGLAGTEHVAAAGKLRITAADARVEHLRGIYRQLYERLKAAGARGEGALHYDLGEGASSIASHPANAIEKFLERATTRNGLDYEAAVVDLEDWLTGEFAEQVQAFEQGAPARLEENARDRKYDELAGRGRDLSEDETFGSVYTDLPESGPVWAWHGTSTTFLPRILKEGLDPSESDAIDKPEHLRGKGTMQEAIYLDLTGARVQWYADQTAAVHGGDPVILRVLVDVEDVEPDPDDADISSGRHQVITRKHIPPTAIYQVNGEWIREARHAVLVRAQVGPQGLAGDWSASGGVPANPWIRYERFALEDNRLSDHDALAIGPDGKWWARSMLGNPEMSDIDSQWRVEGQAQDVDSGRQAAVAALNQARASASLQPVSDPGPYNAPARPVRPTKQKRAPRRISEPETAKMEQAVIDEYGLTENPNTAGYILSSGAMVDLGGGMGHARADDHRIVTEVMPKRWKRWFEMESGGDTQLMNKFMAATGAIRFHYSGGDYALFDFEAMPTGQQLRRINELIEDLNLSSVQIGTIGGGNVDLGYPLNANAVVRALQGGRTAGTIVPPGEAIEEVLDGGWNDLASAAREDDGHEPEMLRRTILRLLKPVARRMGVDLDVDIGRERPDRANRYYIMEGKAGLFRDLGGGPSFRGVRLELAADATKRGHFEVAQLVHEIKSVFGHELLHGEQFERRDNHPGAGVAQSDKDEVAYLSDPQEANAKAWNIATEMLRGGWVRLRDISEGDLPDRLYGQTWQRYQDADISNRTRKRIMRRVSDILIELARRDADSTEQWQSFWTPERYEQSDEEVEPARRDFGQDLKKRYWEERRPTTHNGKLTITAQEVTVGPGAPTALPTAPTALPSGPQDPDEQQPLSPAVLGHLTQRGSGLYERAMAAGGQELETGVIQMGDFGVIRHPDLWGDLSQRRDLDKLNAWLDSVEQTVTQFEEAQRNPGRRGWRSAHVIAPMSAILITAEAIARDAYLRDGKTSGDKAVVVMRVPAALARMWPEEITEENGPPHFTLAYIPGPHDEEAKQRLLTAVRGVVADLAPIPVELAKGVDWFTTDNEDKENREIAHKNVHPETAARMTVLHWKLVEALESEGFALSVRDKFIAHSTLEYCPDRDYDGSVPEGGWTADAIEVWGWPDTPSFTLAGERERQPFGPSPDEPDEAEHSCGVWCLVDHKADDLQFVHDDPAKSSEASALTAAARDLVEDYTALFAQAGRVGGEVLADGAIETLIPSAKLDSDRPLVIKLGPPNASTVIRRLEASEADPLKQIEEARESVQWIRSCFDAMEGKTPEEAIDQLRGLASAVETALRNANRRVPGSLGNRSAGPVYNLDGPSSGGGPRKKKRLVAPTYWRAADDSDLVAYTSQALAGPDAKELKLKSDARVLVEGDTSYIEALEKDSNPTSASLLVAMELLTSAIKNGYDAVRIGDLVTILNEKAIDISKDDRAGWGKRLHDRKRTRSWAS